MTQNEIIEMARQAGFVVTYIGDPIGTNYNMIEAFAKLVAEHEREACAKACDVIAREIDDTNGNATYCAKTIRARGKQEIWPFPRKVIFDDHIMPKFNPDNEEDALL